MSSTTLTSASASSSCTDCPVMMTVSLGAMVGAVIGVAALFFAGFGVLFYLHRRRYTKKLKQMEADIASAHPAFDVESWTPSQSCPTPSSTLVLDQPTPKGAVSSSENTSLRLPSTSDERSHPEMRQNNPSSLGSRPVRVTFQLSSFQERGSRTLNAARVSPPEQLAPMAL